MVVSKKNTKQIQEQIWRDKPFTRCFQIDQVKTFKRGTTGRAFRIKSDEGLLYKLRVCDSETHAQFVAKRVQALPHVFPTFHGVDRQYLLTSFVSGKSLGNQYDSSLPNNTATLTKAFYKLGKLHGKVHQCTHTSEPKDLDTPVFKIFEQLVQKGFISKSEAHTYRTHYDLLRQDNAYQYGLDLRDSHFHNFIHHAEELLFIDEEGIGDIQGIGLVNVLRQLDWSPGTPLNLYGKSFIEGYKNMMPEPLKWQSIVLNSIYHYALTLSDCIRKKNYRRLRTYFRQFPKFFQNESIAHINTKYIYPTQTFVYNYLTNAQQHHPIVLTDIAQNLNKFPVNCRYLLSASQAKALKKDFGSHYGKKMKTFFKQLPFPACYEKLIREKSILLLHAHFGETGYRTLALKHKTNLPLVTSFYGIDASYRLNDPTWCKRFQHLFEEGDLFLALGKDMANRLCKAGCPTEKLRIQHLGINLRQIPFHTRQPLKKEPTTLLFCGRLVEKKGIFDAIDAFAQVAHTHPTLQFRIAGSGHLQPKVEKQIQKLGITNQVTLLGEISHKKALQEMARAHLFILPSKTAPNGDMEGTPTVLLEAQASGLPVVSTHHADIPEVVEDGLTGFLSPEGDVPSLSQHLNTLLKTPETWMNFGEAGRQHIEQNYNIKKEIKNLECHYNELLAF